MQGLPVANRPLQCRLGAGTRPRPSSVAPANGEEKVEAVKPAGPLVPELLRACVRSVQRCTTPAGKLVRPWVPALLPDRLAQRLDELATGLSQGSLSRASLESSGVGCPARPEREKAKVEVPSLASPGEAPRFAEEPGVV